MKQQIYAPNTVPTANIAVNKSRLKVYKNVGNLPTYYLQKGTEFQIELANPTTDVVMAKIILNGKTISQGGLILNPGQRVYLDRYLDVAKKFLFDTYEVSNSKEMQKAIADNGDIKVEFYREELPNYYHGNSTITYLNNNFNYHDNILRSTTNMPLYGSLTTTGGFVHNTPTQGGLAQPTTTSSSGNLSTGSLTTQGINSVNASYTSNLSSPTLDQLDTTLDFGESKRKKIKAASFTNKSVETGRVEQGSDSNQKFKTVSKSFQYYAFHTVEYKILPISQKVNTAEDVNVKVYCTQCGSKLGKTDNFCASCGKKA